MAKSIKSKQDAPEEMADIVKSNDAKFTVSGAESDAEPSDVGALLCTTRKRTGKDLQQIAEVLRIRFNYLHAIEGGRYEELPGQAYALGFIRSYAEYLGLDGDEVIRRYKEENSGMRRVVSFDFPIPMIESGVPSSALVLFAIVVGMAIYGAWYAIAASERGAVELIQEVPSRLAPLLGSNKLMPVGAENSVNILMNSNHPHRPADQWLDFLIDGHEFPEAAGSPFGLAKNLRYKPRSQGG
ncbi:MAG TPA: hypothetical protein DGZ24_05220 [Rhodospirillaceae bacterium]|nr:hypothetical protein [Candidatus Neomarinimicrobiota bacterium]HCX14698.1 hypothetical protein [Rhodospirillaceae bacterium]|tara:strand:+ start:144 stop:866 length:723 start_codon:yes stop_codon:yes gene_type:complete